jgi:predicted PurR-regulated permease PerM
VIFIVGLVMGCFMIIVVTLVYATKQKFGTAGTVLTLVGFALIGLFLFTRIKIVITGIAEIEADLREVQTTIGEIQQQKDTIAAEIRAVTDSLAAIPENALSAGQMQDLRRKVNRIAATSQNIGSSLGRATTSTSNAQSRFQRILRPTK